VTATVGRALAGHGLSDLVLAFTDHPAALPDSVSVVCERARVSGRLPERVFAVCDCTAVSLWLSDGVAPRVFAASAVVCNLSIKTLVGTSLCDVVSDNNTVAVGAGVEAPLDVRVDGDVSFSVTVAVGDGVRIGIGVCTSGGVEVDVGFAVSAGVPVRVCEGTLFDRDNTALTVTGHAHVFQPPIGHVAVCV
jgi:hypothetical protein